MGALGNAAGAWRAFAKRGRTKKAGLACEFVTDAAACGARKDCGIDKDGSCVRVRRGHGKHGRVSYAGRPQTRQGGRTGNTTASDTNSTKAAGDGGGKPGGTGNTTASDADSTKAAGDGDGATTTATAGTTAAGTTTGATGGESSGTMARPATAAAVLFALAASV